MKQSISEQPAGEAELLLLGDVIGQNKAFGMIASRCSAAQAECLWRLREERLYRSINPSWEEFCAAHLKISKSSVDQVIRLWQEFGPAYFQISQWTRISPETYRSIAPAVQDGTLHFGGEAIALIEENAGKVAAAVRKLRQNKTPKQKPYVEMHRRIAALDERCTALLAEFEYISKKERNGENWLQFTAVLRRVAEGLRKLEVTNGLD